MDRGRVKSSTGLNLRNKPNGDRVGVLAHNEQFTILDEVNFYRVRSESGEILIRLVTILGGRQF